MTDVTPTDDSDNCGCCRPPSQANEDRIGRLLARRDAVDQRLRRLEPASAGLRGPNAMAGAGR
jgi:hypothetical protein